ncbi:hypothetical protein [Pseudomonas viridiflava]|uniref:hypothetical protein n=1 Tax=Pseudomonas viridiflava TaxID=33069 RepID=UPI000F07FF3D|nr:hypothetical protein [Pseudomonas viridiflava]
MLFTDTQISKALEIFIRRDEQLQQELANFNRHPGGLFISERRAGTHGQRSCGQRRNAIRRLMTLP